MNLPWLFARRYFYSGKISHSVNLISRISQFGILVGSAALIIVLSVFNGFEEVVLSLYNSFDPDISISVENGKYFQPGKDQIIKLSELNGLKAITPVIEENALVRYHNGQTIATFKGIETEYLHSLGVDSMMIIGEPILTDEEYNYALLGSGIAANLGLNYFDFKLPMQVYFPNKGNPNDFLLHPETAFNILNINPGGVFAIQQDFDNKYILVPLRFMRELVDDSSKITGLELNFDKNTSATALKEQVTGIMGSGFVVNDRFEQHRWLYKIMRTEKFMVFLILSLILVIAAFNLVGSLLMLSIEKKKDMMVLKTLGGDNSFVRKIFYFEGALLSISSAVAGILIGSAFCWIQMKFGLIRFAEGSTFVIDQYPVAFRFLDFIWVFFTVVLIGFLSSWLPARTVSKELTINDLHK